MAKGLSAEASLRDTQLAAQAAEFNSRASTSERELGERVGPLLIGLAAAAPRVWMALAAWQLHLHLRWTVPPSIGLPLPHPLPSRGKR